MSNRIATSALTGRIYMGRVNKAGTDFVGQTTDVTSDVMKAIIDKAEHHGDGGFDIEAGNRRWTVNVTKRTTPDKTPPADSVLEEALRERDEADDFIDTLLDDVLGPDRAEWSSAYGRAEAMEEVRERITALHKPAVDRAWTQFAAAERVLEDAARYRWLRRWKGQEHEPPFTVQHEIDGTLWGGDLDAAIDAARKQGANHD